MKLLRVEPLIASKFYREIAKDFSRRLREFSSHSASIEGIVQVKTIGDPNNSSFKKHFPQINKEVLIKEYNVSYKRNIQFNGLLYLTTGHLCFYSQIFGFEKKSFVNLSNILKFYPKKYNQIELIKLKNENEKAILLTFNSSADCDELCNDLSNLFKNFKQIDNIPASLTQINSDQQSQITDLAKSTFDLQTDLPNQDDWQLILKTAKLISYHKGNHIIKLGDIFQRIYQISVGECIVCKTGDEGDSILGNLGKGDIFGEITFLEGGKTIADVIAVSDLVNVWVIEGSSLSVIFGMKNGLAGRFYKYLATIIAKRLKERQNIAKHL